MNTLYLLGNGFDLACDLPSRYSDYFNKRFSKFENYKVDSPTALEALKTEFLANGCSNIPSVWFFVFAYYHDEKNGKCYSYWKDVESSIESFVTQSSTAFDSLNIQLCKMALTDSSYRTGDITNTSKIIQASNLIYQYLEIQLNKESKEWAEELKSDESTIFKIFIKELKKFEQNFISYLKEVVVGNKLYEERARRLGNEIVDAKTPIKIETSLIGTVGGPMRSIPSEPDNNYLLSFNFTHPFGDMWGKFANIHGSLEDGSAFFGIGGSNFYTKNSDLSQAIRFAKDNRSLSIEDKESGKNLDSILGELHSVGDLQVIKCFGLSLGDADYPYFKQFFDSAHIADRTFKGNSFLGFYYTNGQDREDLIYLIDSLLLQYSLDIDYNSSVGLMRELKNAGRLAITELKDVRELIK